MNNLHIFFHKTIALANMLEQPVLHNFSSAQQTDQTVINKAFYQHVQHRFQTNEHLEMITQILDVEQEKFSLRDSNSEEINAIITSAYTKYNHDLEKLLQLSIEELKEINLQQNSYIESYATDWKFVFLNETDQDNLLDKVLEYPKDEYYFLFQRTDVFDHVLQTNVMEFHLTKYEYYVLHLFQEKTSVKNVMQEFMTVFEVETAAELQSLTKEIIRIIKFLIYRKFIVQ